MIKLEGLSKAFGKKQVLKDITITFEQGKTYGIVGHNGAGKTTLFKCICGLLNHQGKIFSKFDKLKDEIGYLETNPQFMSYLTGREYLQLMTSARNHTSIDFRKQNIFNLPLEDYANHYSTGMKKKLALLGVLLQKNAIYIFDEPFNGVDIHSNMIISAIMQKLKNEGKTILISSHIFSTLKENCDEIFVLNDGQFSQSVSPQHYNELENQLKDFILGTKLDQLDV